MQIPFKSVSISHKSAPLTVREQVALNDDESKAFAIQCKEKYDINDLLIVSTPNSS